jgi:hypothetical protein
MSVHQQTSVMPDAAALTDVDARPRVGIVMQAVAVGLTASPVLAVAIWSLTQLTL